MLQLAADFHGGPDVIAGPVEPGADSRAKTARGRTIRGIARNNGKQRGTYALRLLEESGSN